MDSKEQIIKAIDTSVNDSSTKGIKKVIDDISKDFNFEMYNWITDLFMGEELDTRTKLLFCLNGIRVREDSNESINNVFTRQVIPALLSELLMHNEDEFIDLISENDKMQELLVNYIRNEPSDAMQIWHRVSNLKIVKKEILNDEDFISNKLSDEREFFENLPQEYANLICYYNAEFRELDYNYLQYLYEKYFGTILNEKERIDLTALHYHNLKLGNNIGISTKIRMQPVNFVLSEVQKNNNYMSEISEFQNKSNLKFIPAVLFMYKYHNEELYKEITELNELNNGLQEKIVYLAQADRIVGIRTLEDLNCVNLNELKKMDNEVIYVSELESTGGPESKTSSRIFSDSSYREIRRINKDGSMKKIAVGNQESHESAVARIYEEDIDFSSDCITAWQRSIESAKRLSAVTLVIENEQCHIYMPSNISFNQVKKCTELIYSATDSSKFGIAVYDRDKDKTYVNGFDLLKKEEARDFLSRIRKKSIQASFSEGEVIDIQ